LKSSTTKAFRAAYSKLSKQVQKQAREAYRLFAKDLKHPSLQFKKVHPSRPIYSVRINLSHRALGVKDGDSIVWFWIGSHGEYDRLTS
jgi:isopenicillin N synthase-like dioxygenase